MISREPVTHVNQAAKSTAPFFCFFLTTATSLRFRKKKRKRIEKNEESQQRTRLPGADHSSERGRNGWPWDALPAVGSRSPPAPPPRHVAVPRCHLRARHGEDDATRAPAGSHPAGSAPRLFSLCLQSPCSLPVPGHFLPPPPHTLLPPPSPSPIPRSCSLPGYPASLLLLGLGRRRRSPRARARSRCAARVAGLGSAAGWRRSRCPARGSGSCGPAAARRDPAGSGGAGWTCRRCSSGGRTPSRVRLSTLSILTRSVAGSPRFSLSLLHSGSCGWLRLSYTHASFIPSPIHMSALRPVKRSGAVTELGTCISWQQYALALPVATAIISISEPMGVIYLYFLFFSLSRYLCG